MTGLERVVIVGGGTAGWMAAAALARALRNSGLAIELVESDEIGTIGVGEATVPDIRLFNRFLGIDESDVMRECRGTFKLGIEFLDWGALGRRYFHSFTGYGLDPSARQFHRLYQKYALAKQSRGECACFDNFNSGACAARAGKFSLGQQDRAPSSGALNYALHFDASLYAGYLRKYAEAAGVTRIQGRVVSVEQNAETGFLMHVKLADGQAIGADLFIDCTGFAGLLIEGALETGYEEWSHWLPCNTAVAVATESVEPPAPFTRSTADLAGWIWRIPLQHRVGNGYVYCDRYISDDEAERRLLSHISGKPLAAPRRIRFSPGKRKKVWNRNCIALGLAAGFLEPLESTSIHLIQSSLMRLISFFPDKSFDQAEIDDFNRRTDEEIVDVRDFIIAHYKLTSRDDAPFWRECRDMQVPERVRTIIELFSAKGRFTPKPEQLFNIHSWLAILYGQGELPRGYDPLLLPMPEAQLDQEMEKIRALIRSSTDAMPAHVDALRQFGAMRDEVLT